MKIPNLKNNFSQSFLDTTLIEQRLGIKTFSSVARWYLEEICDIIIKKAVDKAREKHPDFLIGDSHVHTYHSDGRKSVKYCVNVAEKRGLDFILITDHLGPFYPIEQLIKSITDQRIIVENDNKKIKLLPAVEISSIKGHVQAFFPQEYYSEQYFSKLEKLRYWESLDTKGPSLKEIFKSINDIGGKIIIPHPDAMGILKPKKRYGVCPELIKEYKDSINAIEQYNSMNPDSMNLEYDITKLGGSDSHLNFDIGSCFSAVENKGDLFDSISYGKTYAYAPVFFSKHNKKLLNKAIWTYMTISKKLNPNVYFD